MGLPDFYKEGTLNRLSNVPFIRTKALPREGQPAGATVLCRPGEVFFAPEDPENDSQYKVYRLLFLFVNFGKAANSFLEVAGVKRQPSTEQLAGLLVSQPAKFLQLAQTHQV